MEYVIFSCLNGSENTSVKQLVCLAMIVYEIQPSADGQIDKHKKV